MNDPTLPVDELVLAVTEHGTDGLPVGGFGGFGGLGGSGGFGFVVVSIGGVGGFGGLGVVVVSTGGIGGTGVVVVSVATEATCPFEKRPKVMAVSATNNFRNIVMILIVI